MDLARLLVDLATDRSEAILHGSHDVTKLEEDISDDRFRSPRSARSGARRAGHEQLGQAGLEHRGDEELRNWAHTAAQAGQADWAQPGARARALEDRRLRSQSDRASRRRPRANHP